MVKEEKENNLSDTHCVQFRSLIHDHTEIFRTVLGSDPPCKVSPMEIRFLKDAVPIRVKTGRYAQAQAEFLREEVEKLERLGLVKKNSSSSWASAPIIVPKPGPEQFRFTVDFWLVKKVTIPHAWAMPDLEYVTAKLRGNRVFASIDIFQGYWKLPLSENYRECQNFITQNGVYSPTRVMNDQINAVSYFQSVVQTICKPLENSFLLLLNELLLYAVNETDLLDFLETFLDIYEKYGLKIHAKKCKSYFREV